MGVDGGAGHRVNREGARRAVFLDRDGVLNANVFYSDTGQWESPRTSAEFAWLPGVMPALRGLADAGYLLFVVSNQPNVVKGKTTLQDFACMCERLAGDLRAGGVPLAGVFYCTHHPEFTGACACRKPSPYFLRQAAREHALALRGCWMIGDRSSDMECGRRAGTRTAWVDTGQQCVAPASGLCDLVARSLAEAADAVLALERRGARRLNLQERDRLSGSCPM